MDQRIKEDEGQQYHKLEYIEDYSNLKQKVLVSSWSKRLCDSK
jgi:hypothetical protein